MDKANIGLAKDDKLGNALGTEELPEDRVNNAGNSEAEETGAEVIGAEVRLEAGTELKDCNKGPDREKNGVNNCTLIPRKLKGNPDRELGRDRLLKLVSKETRGNKAGSKITVDPLESSEPRGCNDENSTGALDITSST